MVRVVVYSLLAIFLVGGFYILQTETAKQKALIKEYNADLRESQGRLDSLQEGDLKADIKDVYTKTCIQQSSEGGKLEEAGIDVKGFCGCMADAHLKLDLSINEETAQRREFYSKGKPCFTGYMKDPFINSCNKKALIKGINVDCTCLYAHSVREQVTRWILGTKGAENSKSFEEMAALQAQNAQDALKECMKH